MAVRAQHLAFGQFLGDALKPVAAPNHLADVHSLLAAYVIEFQDNWIGFAAMNTRMG